MIFTKIPAFSDSELKIRCKLNINEIMNALDICLDESDEIIQTNDLDDWTLNGRLDDRRK